MHGAGWECGQVEQSLSGKDAFMSASPHPHRFLSLPHHRSAWVSVTFLAFFLTTLGLNLWTTSDGSPEGALVFMTFLAMLAMVGSLALSTFAIMRQAERSVLAYLSFFTGALVVVFFIVEILMGHE
jgi:heme/copper-type cytochrome/quinol oxidase subunit 4